MSPDQVHRYARHITLAEVGPGGQEALLAAHVLLVGDDLAMETAALYLGAAGTPLVRVAHAPASTSAWRAAFTNATVVLRSGFEDDAMLHVARQAGVPAVIVRVNEAGVDLLTFIHPAEPALELPDLPPSPPARAAMASDPAPLEALQTLAGTLAATEALWLIIGRPGQGPGARHLHIPSDAQVPRTRAIPWPPAAQTAPRVVMSNRL